MNFLLKSSILAEKFIINAIDLTLLLDIDCHKKTLLKIWINRIEIVILVKALIIKPLKYAIILD